MFGREINTFGNTSGQQNTSASFGGSGFRYDPRIGNNPLPAGTQGTANRAYTRTPQNNELVSSQLQGLLGQDSRYIQNARQRGLEGAATRGQFNSSMAAGAAERAAIEAGLPIAQADAGAYGQAASENLGYLNQAMLQEGQLSTQERIANANLQASLGQGQAGAAAALQLQRERLAYEGEQAGLGRAHQLGMGQFGLGANLTQMGYGAQWDNWLQDQGTTRGMERDMYNTQLGMIGNYGNFLNQTMGNALMYGMMNPEFMASPEQMSGFLGGISQMTMPMFTNFFNSIFGGGG